MLSQEQANLVHGGRLCSKKVLNKESRHYTTTTLRSPTMSANGSFYCVTFTTKCNNINCTNIKKPG